MPITITDRAAEKGRELLGRDGKSLANPGLRVRVVGGGCSGLSYQMSFDEAKPEDQVFEHNGLRVLVDKKSLLFLNGSQLDYAEGLTGAGFRFQNPNVKGSCGCGESFHV
jgi:iron-sulfur cluster assembly protein